MTRTKVSSDKEVILGSNAYPIKGRIRSQLISRFPEKINYGDDTFEQENLLTNWILTDMRDGMGVDEATKTQLARFLWSSCDTLHNGYITLQPLATAVSPTAITMGSLVDGGLETWTSGTNLTNWTETLGGGEVNKSTSRKYGSYSANLKQNPVGAGNFGLIYQALATFDTDVQGKWVSCSAWMKAEAGTQVSAKLGIQDTAAAASYGTAVTNDDAWHLVGYGKTMDAAADRCVIYARNIYGAADTATGDDAWVDDIKGPSTTGGQVWCKFNGNTYFTKGTYLYRILDADGSITLLGSMPDVVTDMKSSIGNTLYIACGLDSPYVYMDTSESFTLSVPDDDAGPEFFIEYDSTHLGKITSTGAFRYCTNPGTAASTWVACGSISDLTGATVRGMFMAANASGTVVPYVSTTQGLYVADTANAKFLKTDVTVPGDDYNGYGYCYWRGNIYYSNGCNVLKYNPIAGTITEIGINNDDGLPGWSNGDAYFSAFIPGRYRIYALFKTILARTGITALYAYNERGWHAYWTPSLTDHDMTAGIISDTYSFRLWFDWNDTIYWIAEQESNLAPKKISGYTYENETANVVGVHVYSGMNGGTKTEAKCVKKVNLFVSGISTGDTIAVSYATDTLPLALNTGWTAMSPTATLANGNNEYLFASGAGITCKCIWIRADITRAATNTNSPCIHNATISYLVSKSKKWMWDFTIDCTEQSGTIDGLTPRAREDALITTINSTTLPLFCFRNASGTTENHYVDIIGPTGGEIKPGDEYRGLYHVTVVEP